MLKLGLFSASKSKLSMSAYTRVRLGDGIPQRDGISPGKYVANTEVLVSKAAD
jgi:hypothetical protein